MGGPRPSVSQARAWDASPLLRQATEWEDGHDQITRYTGAASQHVNESTDFWRGDAGEAMRERHTLAASAAKGVQTALADAAIAARGGYQSISEADTTALHAIRNAELDGYQLSDDGTATVTPAQTVTALTLGSKAATALAVLDNGARMHTTAVQTSLAGLGSADTATATAIDAAFTPMQATPMRTGWWSWIVDAVVIVATIPLDDIGVGEALDAATIAAMRQAGKDAVEQAAKNGASKEEAEQAGKDAMKKFAQDHANDPVNLAKKIDLDNINETKTVRDHLDEYSKDGRLARPYANSKQMMREIMDSSTPTADPGGVPGAVRWDAPGSLNGKPGSYEMVVDTNTNTILHFLFKAAKG